MATKTVKIAEHKNLMPMEEGSKESGMRTESLRRAAREGRGPKIVRIGNRSYLWRPQFEEWLRKKFEDE